MTVFAEDNDAGSFFESFSNPKS